MCLLDLYAGCGAMSISMCIGTSLSGVKLVTWKIFLSFLKEWEKLCQQFSFFGSDKELEQSLNLVSKEEEHEEQEEEEEEEEEENDNTSPMFLIRILKWKGY
ncbi:hypothetical protein Pint_34077 [Pistacia integerrima]|uniref:Uncharacterized protein n=1 Tax=Pistacia integerrima TaxID=434235 RepID=A0ACC0X6Y9_9ROSI|nr:hypothetical protein Pint_34077 [Pistacia integerrima]